MDQSRGITIKTTLDLLAFLKNKYELKELSHELISKSLLDNMFGNAKYGEKNQDELLLSDMHIFEIKKTEDNKEYFAEALTDYTRLYFPVEYPKKRNY